MNDIPCACSSCGIVFVDARDRVAVPRERAIRMGGEDFIDSGHGNSFMAKPCPVCKGEMCRLLSGPLYVPRPG